MLAYLACLLTVAFIPIHVYWATGGQFALPGGAHTAALAALRVANWGVAVLLAIGAVLLLALGRYPGRWIPAGVLAPIWIGSVVCVSHAILGLVTKGLYVGGLHGAVNFPIRGWTDAQKQSAALNDLRLFEPWFLLEGLLLALAGWQVLGTATARRRWMVALLVGIAAVDGFGAALSVARLHFAVS